MVGYFGPQYAPRQFSMIAGGVSRYIRVNPERGAGYTPDAVCTTLPFRPSELPEAVVAKSEPLGVIHNFSTT
jgi:hypothetical protein